MPADRTRRKKKTSEAVTASGSGSTHPSNPVEAGIQLRRSARLATKANDIVERKVKRPRAKKRPINEEAPELQVQPEVTKRKPVVPNHRMLKPFPGPGIPAYLPVEKDDLPKVPTWPEIDRVQGMLGNRRLKKEHSFTALECGTHLEMISPGAVTNFGVIPDSFRGLSFARYHAFGRDISEKELAKKMGVKLEVKAMPTASAKKRRRETDVDKEEGSSRPMKRVRLSLEGSAGR